VCESAIEDVESSPLKGRKAFFLLQVYNRDSGIFWQPSIHQIAHRSRKGTREGLLLSPKGLQGSSKLSDCSVDILKIKSGYSPSRMLLSFRNCCFVNHDVPWRGNCGGRLSGALWRVRLRRCLVLNRWLRPRIGTRARSCIE
jgi:hypothetical protein